MSTRGLVIGVAVGAGADGAGEDVQRLRCSDCHFSIHFEHHAEAELEDGVDATERLEEQEVLKVQNLHRLRCAIAAGANRNRTFAEQIVRAG